MDGGEERWRLLRCAGGGQDKTIINQIMLRFRPIAPKPVSGAPDSDLSYLNNKNLLLSKRRTKRKYVRIRKNNKLIKRNQKVSSPSSSDHGKGNERQDGSFEKVVTLQLLPERSDDQFKDSTERGRSWCNLDLTEEFLVHNPVNNQAASMRLKLKQPVIYGEDHQTVEMVPKRRLILESWVTVESVTDTNGCMEGRGLGCTDVERVKNLEEDTRPGFISDGSNRVWWVNGAYKRMVSVMEEEKESESVEIMVCLVTKEKLVPYMYCCVFTCWVRLQYAWKEEKWWSQIVPCDVWRMDCGGFAWRLDVEAALGLGR